MQMPLKELLLLPRYVALFGPHPLIPTASVFVLLMYVPKFTNT